MSAILQIDRLTKSYGDRILFENITFGIDEGEKVGIIAKNGTGKSTLLKIIAGQESPDSGCVVWRNDTRIGYLPQKPMFDDTMSVAQAAVKSDSPEAGAVRAYHEAMASGNPEQINDALHRMDECRAWDYEDRLKQILGQLGLHDSNARISTLSGGQRKRVALAAIIIDQPQVLILDEPTNHLDIEVIEWLETYLSRARCTLLMVTHDRYFLDRVCSRIIEIDNRTTYSYTGNYNHYLRRRAERIEAMSAEMDKIRNTLRREQQWMNRQPQARAGKAKFRIDSFHKLKQRQQQAYRPDSNMSINVETSYIGSKIFEAQNISKSFGDKVILRDFSYTFSRHEKVGIIGPNGVGKSTFIKMLQGLIEADNGSWNVGETVRFGYYNQEGFYFDPDKKVIDVMEEEINASGSESMTAIQYLSRFLFSAADRQKYIRTLSGGELCRLHLAIVLMHRPNFLILDEPTNDLDIITLGILEEYLAEFNGCVIIVSHDRYFLDNIVDHLFVMEGNGEVVDFPGTYTEYFECRRNALPEPTAHQESKPKQERSRNGGERPKRMSFSQRKEFEALTTELEALNAEKAEIEQKFSESSPSEDIATLSVRYQQLTEIIDEKELRWLELSELQ